MIRRVIRRRGDRPLSLGGEEGKLVFEEGNLIVLLLELGGSGWESSVGQILTRDIAEEQRRRRGKVSHFEGLAERFEGVHRR